jgi:Recombination endonuclease VII
MADRSPESRERHNEQMAARFRALTDEQVAAEKARKAAEYSALTPAQRARRLSNERAAYAITKKVRRDKKIFKKYGLTAAAFDALLEVQMGHCAICPRPLAPSGLGTHVDHDHLTGKIRGVLCGCCNRGIGQLGDSAERVQSAADYLKAHR